MANISVITEEMGILEHYLSPLIPNMLLTVPKFRAAKAFKDAVK